MKRTLNRTIYDFLSSIHAEMQENDVTQTALAKRLGVSRPYVTKVLSGDVNISFQTAARFADALGMDFAPELSEQGQRVLASRKSRSKHEVAILMAAGLGSRMRPLTDKLAKPLVPVIGRPLVETVIAALLKRVGHDVIQINLVNDRGIHICKSMIAYQRFGNGVTPESTGIKGDHLVGNFYVRYNQALSEEIAALKAENASLRREITALKERLKEAGQ